MIKAKMKTTKGDVVLLGLSEGNLVKLKDSKPILIRGADVGIEHDIVIIYGATEQDIMDDMVAHNLIPKNQIQTHNHTVH